MAKGSLDRVGVDRVAVVAYRLTRADGEAVEEVSADAPLVYLHGHAQIPASLEDALEDRAVGKAFEAEVPSAGWLSAGSDAGHRVIPRDALAPGAPLEAGAELTLTEGDDTFPAWVAEVGADRVRISLSPPWGDAPLALRAEVLAVRAPTGQELADGRATRADAASTHEAGEVEAPPGDGVESE